MNTTEQGSRTLHSTDVHETRTTTDEVNSDTVGDKTDRSSSLSLSFSFIIATPPIPSTSLTSHPLATPHSFSAHHGL